MKLGIILYGVLLLACHSFVASPPEKLLDRLQLDQFESLSITPPGPGQPGLSPALLPRPLGDAVENMVEAPPLAHPSNCSARYMRVTVSAIPSQQVPPFL